jgi:hypothetical protein
MPEIILPVAKMLYVCDDVVRDPQSGKVSVLNIWETVNAKSFPHSLDKLCVFAQFRSGLGEIPFEIEIMDADTGDMIGQTMRFALFFKDRTVRHDLIGKIKPVVFPSPGTYFVTMYCNNEFVDDQPIRVKSRHS